MASVLSSDISDSILKGECPFFMDVPGKKIPVFAPSSDILPQEIKRLFTLAFVDGHTSPSVRPSAETWYYALERLEKSLKPCRDVGHHEYYNALNSCPWCETEQRFSGVLSSTKSGGLKQSTFTPPEW
jgi:DNA-binding helix-hairpin-helix protein with protein kinase domain